MEYLLIAKNPAFEIPALFNVSSSGEQLVLHEIFNKIELYCLAQDSLDLSLNMESWFIDGTFSKVSSQIMQLYNAHGLNQGRNDINAYFLLTNKRCHTYSEVLAQIEIPINQVYFNSIMIDFE